MRLATMTAVITLSLTTAAPTFAQADPQLARDVDAFVSQLMTHNVAPGLAIAVVRGNEPLIING